MNDVVTPVADATAPATEIALLVQNPVAVLTDSAKFDEFYARIKAEVDGHVPDLSTATGRKAIASLAFKVVKTKTALDDAGKKLTEDKRREIAAVDAARKNIRDKLDELRDEVRKPLTEWEAAEEIRVSTCQRTIAAWKSGAVISIDDTSEAVAARLAAISAAEVTQEQFGDLFDFATDTRRLAIDALTAGHTRLTQEEADRAELARLRQESEARAAREAEERAAAEVREREAAEARQREEAAARAREQAEAEAQERAQREEQERQEATARAEQEARDREAAARRAAEEAAEQARLEAQRRAEEEQAQRDRDHQEQLAAEARARESAEAEARTLREAAEARERQEVATREAAEARARDIEHRAPIMRAAKEALMEHVELDEPTAKKAVLAIAAGSIPHVTIQF